MELFILAIEQDVFHGVACSCHGAGHLSKEWLVLTKEWPALSVQGL